MQEILLGFFFGALKILSAIVLSAGALYSGIMLLDRLTPGIDEWDLLKKGNAAIGLFYSSVMASLFLLMQERISDFVFFVQQSLPIHLTLLVLFFALFNYIIQLLLSIVIVYLTIHVIDRITPDVEELQELENGNIAVSLIMSIVLLAVVLACHEPLEGIISILKSLEPIL